MTSGIPFRIDGPLPLVPRYGLLQAANGSEAVRIIPDADALGIERWGNGVVVYPYPGDEGAVFDSCGVYSSTPETKAEGETLEHPEFDAMVVYLAETCTSYRIWNQEEFRARAVAAFSAIEGRAVEREFLAGDVFSGQPHLADGEGEYPNGNGATDIMNGLALLETEIAGSGRQGVIHLTPALATAAADRHLIADVGGVLRTINGTTVIPGQGYAGSIKPNGRAQSSGTAEWAFATGPVDVRRSEVVTVPDDVSQAIEKETNKITYRVERYYLVDWDEVLQAAVLIDRCRATC